MPSADGGPDVRRQVVDERAPLGRQAEQVEGVVEDPRLRLAHPDLAGDDDDVEHVRPAVARVVVAPRVRQQRRTDAGGVRAVHEADHVGGVLEAVEHPARAARRGRRPRRSGCAATTASRCSKSGTSISPRSRACTGFQTASAPPDEPSQRRMTSRNSARSMSSASAHAAIDVSERRREDAAPVDDQAGERAVVRHPPPPGHGRAGRARPCRGSRRRRRRSCRRATGGSSPRGGWRASRRASVANQRVSPADRPVVASHRATSSARVGNPPADVGDIPIGTGSPGLRPEREQVAEVGPRVTDGRHLPVDDAPGPARPAGSTIALSSLKSPCTTVGGTGSGRWAVSQSRTTS